MNTTSERVLDAMHVVWAEGLHALCTKQDGKPFQVVGFFSDYESLIERAALLPEGSNVWWGVHGMTKPAKSGRGGVDDVTEIIALSADYDWADANAHKETDLPSEKVVRDTVAKMEPQPTVVINSGHGLQLYWVLQHPVVRFNGQDLIDGFFRYIEAEYGLKNDRADLASILRLPGSINNKSDCEPVEVIVEEINDVAWNPEWLRDWCWLDMKEPEVITPPVPAPTVVQRVNGSEQPSEWMNKQYIIPQLLTEGGWTEMKNGEWCRPGKNPRDGNSAHYYPENNVLNIFSTAAPTAFLNLGKQAQGGAISCTPSDVYAAVHFDGDLKAAWRHIGLNLMPKTESMPTARIDTDSPTAKAEDSEKPSTDLNLPPEFWESRDYLTKIREAAWSRLISPDAVLGAFLARVATKIPVSYVIPPIVGAQATFDHLSVLVGDSSRGKSASAAIAAELFPENNEKNIVWDFPAPSGEGLIDAFFEMVAVDPEKPKVKEKRQTKTAVMFTLDEGMALISQTQRSGTTIASVICSAWAGATIGQGNASEERKRIIKKGRARVSGLMGIQTSLGHNFLTDTLVEQGLAGRIVWFSAEDPEIPFDGPQFPSPITIPRMDVISNALTVIEYAPEIRHEIRLRHWEVATKKAHEDPIDGHVRLARLKIAGIFALIEGRQSVNLDDWNLAENVLITSTAIRNRMKQVGSEAKMQAVVTQGTMQGTRELAAEDVRERQKIAKLTESIIRHVPPEGISSGKLSRAVTSKTTRHRYLPALDQALDRGAIKYKDEKYYPA